MLWLALMIMTYYYKRLKPVSTCKYLLVWNKQLNSLLIYFKCETLQVKHPKAGAKTQQTFISTFKNIYFLYLGLNKLLCLTIFYYFEIEFENRPKFYKSKETLF